MFSAISTTYGAGDGSTTFALPNLIDKFVEGSATAGTVMAAGLPNITGYVDVKPRTTNGSNIPALVGEASGAFTTRSIDFNYAFSFAQVASATYARGIELNASRSSSIYGNSTTVQPPALTMKPFIYTGKTNVNKWLRTA